MRILRSIGRFCECDPMDGLKIHIFPFKAENTTYYKPSSRSRLPRAPLSAGSASLMVAPQTAAFVPFRPIITLLLLGFPEPFARQGRKKGQGGPESAAGSGNRSTGGGQCQKLVSQSCQMDGF